jgi:hypothetical protein
MPFEYSTMEKATSSYRPGTICSAFVGRSYEVVPLKLIIPLPGYHRQHDMGRELPVMIDGLHGQSYLRVLAEETTRIEVTVPLGEIAAGDLDAYAVPGFEHVAGSPQAKGIFVDFAGLDGLHCRT